MDLSEDEGVKIEGCLYGPAEHGPCLGEELLGVHEVTRTKVREDQPPEAMDRLL